jgi:hypothetical protein
MYLKQSIHNHIRYFEAIHVKKRKSKAKIYLLWDINLSWFSIRTAYDSEQQCLGVNLNDIVRSVNLKYVKLFDFTMTYLIMILSWRVYYGKYTWSNRGVNKVRETLKYKINFETS